MKIQTKIALLLGSILLVSCKPIDKKDVTVNQKTEPDLTFTCVYEKDATAR